MSGKKDSVRVFEVGARDGLQNESRVVSFEQKIEFVNGLIGAGVQALELGAFVHPEWVPQMTDTDALFAAVHSKKIKAGKKTELWALVPNMRGLERAMAVGVDRIAIFTAASETFTKKNIGKSIAESLHEYREVTTHARKWGMKVRGYISTVFGCPFEGKIGEAARQAWEENKDKVPTIEEEKLDDTYKKVGLGALLGAIVYKAF